MTARLRAGVGGAWGSGIAADVEWVDREDGGDFDDNVGAAGGL